MHLDDQRIALIPFDDLADLMMPLGCINSPSELHGMLCGKLCGGADLAEGEWLEQATEFMDVGGGIGLEVSEALRDMLQTTRSQFLDEDYALEILLPPDYMDLDQRVSALSQWCHGFLTGFGTAGLAGDQAFSPTSAEAIRDLAQIVQASIDDEDMDEDDAENDYFNLAEYVRMAVLSLYSDFGELIEVDPPSESSEDDEEDDEVINPLH